MVDMNKQKMDVACAVQLQNPHQRTLPGRCADVAADIGVDNMVDAVETERLTKIKTHLAYLDTAGRPAGQSRFGLLQQGLKKALQPGSTGRTVTPMNDQQTDQACVQALKKPNQQTLPDRCADIAADIGFDGGVDAGETTRLNSLRSQLSQPQFGVFRDGLYAALHTGVANLLDIVHNPQKPGRALLTAYIRLLDGKYTTKDRSVLVEHRSYSIRGLVSTLNRDINKNAAFGITVTVKKEPIPGTTAERYVATPTIRNHSLWYNGTPSLQRILHAALSRLDQIEASQAD